VAAAPVGNATAPVAEPVVAQPVAQPVAAAPVQAPVAEEEDKRKRSILESITGFFAKRDYSRKRMVVSRIVDVQKRGQWI
jgi:hypothetical protein